MSITTLDWFVIGAYFAAVVAIAAWAIKRERSGRETYLVGLAGAGASSGLVLGQYELQASIILLLLGWVFVPFYIRSGVIVTG